MKRTKQVVYNDMLREIELSSQALKLPDKIQEEATNIFKKYMKKYGLQGKKIDQYAPAFVYLACKKWNQPITTKLMNEMFNLDIEIISKNGKGTVISSRKGSLVIAKIARKIGRELGENFQPIGIDKYIEMAQAKVLSDDMCKTRAMFLLEYMKTHDITLNNSPAFAAAVAYLADRLEGYRIPEHDYCIAIGTTEVALRNCKKKMLKVIPNIKRHGTKYVWKDYGPIKTPVETGQDNVPNNDNEKQ